ncbi:MAG: DUF4249 family protein [Chitinispirillaceae bacterium]|nr:DUF4249 family protein [Chitinispirillaceae bacterium]
MKMTTVKTGIGGMLLCAAAMLSCNTGTEPAGYDKDAIIIQASLTAGQPVTYVYLLHLAKLYVDTVVKARWNGWPTDPNYDPNNGRDSSDTITLTRDSIIEDAEVTISTGDTSYTLDYVGYGMYSDTIRKLVVTAGKTYRLDVHYNGMHAWAQTTVPFPEGGLSINRDTLYTLKDGEVKMKYYDFSGPDIPDDGIPDSLQSLFVTFSKPRKAFYYNYYSFYNNTYSGLNYWISNAKYYSTDSMKVISSSYWTKKSVFESCPVVLSLAQPARYKLLIYTITPDFYDLLEKMVDTTYQDQWSEPPTNINNGLGFFTSMSPDSIFFDVVEMDNGIEIPDKTGK